MMRRPGLWLANGHPGDTTEMYSWRPGSLTCFYDYLAFNNVFQYKADNPDAPIIVRFQHPLNWHENPKFYAEQLGRQIASKWDRLKEMDPYIYYANEMNLHYENGDPGPGNQPRYETPEFYQKYADWVRMTADVVKNIVPEMKLITPPFAFGHHEDGAPDDDGNPKDGWAGYDFLADTIETYFDNILTFHAYWGNAHGSVREWLYDPEISSWFAFRWKRVLKLFETRYNIQAKMIIDEAGNFATTDSDFTDQILYHAEKCLNDGRVIALTYFLWLDPTNTAGNLPNSWVQGAQNLRTHVQRMKAMPDVIITEHAPEQPVQQERTIRVLQDDGTVKVMLLEEYLRAVVPAEMPALWAPEAVKAQAVASRSYAQYAVENPRHENADICTSPAHCQNYDEEKIHEKADEAIAQTNGIIALYNGATANGIFSANCGGHTFDNEDVWAGAPVAYLRGVDCPDKGEKFGHGVGMCQYGAKAFAEQGIGYEDIIRHYYTGVTLGEPTRVRTSSVVGTIIDHLGQPMAGVTIVLSGMGQAAEGRSNNQGIYRFSNIPIGLYSLELPDYQVKQAELRPVPGQDLVINFNLPDPDAAMIRVEVERGTGLPLIVGDWGKANEPVTVQAPSGKVFRTITGVKPEFGSGGFEAYAQEIGTYLIEIENYTFEIPMSGQFTRLSFKRGGTVQPTGSVEGELLDHLDRPVVNRLIHLLSDTIDLTDATTQQGRFFFENLPAGSYRITVEESEITQTVTITGKNQVTLSLKLPPPPNMGDWEVELRRGGGLPLLVGDIGVANQMITFTDPKGFQTRVFSGSKPEWGVGGFEAYAPETGTYVVQFMDQTFHIPMTGQFTQAIFRKKEKAQVRLVSALLTRSQAQEILANELNINPATRDLFGISD